MASRPLPHTLGHFNCPACEAARLEAIRATDLKDLTFDKAVELWLADRQMDVSPRTHADHEDFAGRLGRFFGEMPLKEIHIGHVKRYQLARQGKDPTLDLGRAGPELINHEIGAVLAKMLEKAGLWGQIRPYYRRLKVSRSTRARVLTQEEEQRLFICASSNPRWKVAYWCSLLTANTGAGPGEIRKMKVREIDLRNRRISIEEGAKLHNDVRNRDFPLATDTLMWIAGNLLKRYFKLAHKHGWEPSSEHYVLPGRRGRNGHYDPTKPMGDWRSAWESLTDKADLRGLRHYDLRHHALTKGMESPEITEHTLEEIAGHIDKKTKRQYRHIRDKAKEQALRLLEVKPAPIIIEIAEKIVEIPAISSPTAQNDDEK